MTLCNWENPSPEFGERFRCVRCGKRVKRDQSISVLPYNRQCKVERGECRHLGTKSGSVECETCAGRVMVKVFGCAIHGECTLAKTIDEAACCAGCDDHSSI